MFRGAYLDHRVKEGLLEVTWDEESGEFAYAEPKGGRALLELAPTPSWHALQFRAADASRRRTAGGAAKPNACSTGRARASRISRTAPSGTMSSSGSSSSPCGQKLTKPKPGSADERPQPVERPVEELDGHLDLLEAVLGLERSMRRRIRFTSSSSGPAMPGVQIARAQKRLPSSRDAPRCARPRSVITRPRGVRWR